MKDYNDYYKDYKTWPMFTFKAVTSVRAKDLEEALEIVKSETRGNWDIALIKGENDDEHLLSDSD